MGIALLAAVMKKTSTLLAIGSALALSGTAHAEIEGEVHAGFNTDYVFRGADLGGTNYEVGADIGGSLSCGIDWSLGVWWIDAEESVVGNSGWEEIDFYGELSKDVGFGTVAVGFVNYNYGDADFGLSGTGRDLPDDNEIYLSVATQFNDISASLQLNYGFNGGFTFSESLILEGGLGYDFDFTEDFSGSLSVDAGYVIDEGDTSSGSLSDDGFAFFSVSLSGSYAITEQISFNPYITYASGNDDVWTYFTNNPGDGPAYDFSGVYGGASLSVSF